MMAECGEHTGIPLHVFGPETHLTSIVAYALGTREKPVTDSGPTFNVPTFEIPNSASSNQELLLHEVCPRKLLKEWKLLLYVYSFPF